jgi:hypothetical protein
MMGKIPVLGIIIGFRESSCDGEGNLNPGHRSLWRQKKVNSKITADFFKVKNQLYKNEPFETEIRLYRN